MPVNSQSPREERGSEANERCLEVSGLRLPGQLQPSKREGPAWVQACWWEKDVKLGGLAASLPDVLECESRFPVAGPGLLGCVRVVCGIYVIYARYLRVSVQNVHFSTEVAYRIALLLYHFASPLSRRLHHSLTHSRY